MSKVRYKEFYETVAKGYAGLDNQLNKWLDANPDVVVKDIKFSFCVSDGYSRMAIALVAYEIMKEKEEESVNMDSSGRWCPFDRGVVHG